MAKRVVVVGAGAGGLATAALLAKRGYAVTVVEKNHEIGGRGRVWEKDGFRFDMGPSWYLMPDVFEHFFDIFNKKPSDFYQLQRLHPNYRIYFDTGRTVDVPSDTQDIYALFDTFELEGGRKLMTFLQESQRRYDIAMRSFVYRSYDSFASVLQPQLLREGLRLKVFGSLGRYIQDTFSSDEARKIVQYPIVFLGGDPHNTPALYSIMSHIDFNMGVWYPLGGLGNVFSALRTLGEQNGVRYLLGNEVSGFKVKDKTILGVTTAHGEFDADYVVMNGDVWHCETSLLDASLRAYDESYWQKRVVAPSAFIIYLGLHKKLQNVKHHTLVFAHDWQKHFRDIFESPSWTKEPSYYVCCPSQTDASVAPEGMENLFVLVPLASGLDDGDAQREAYAEMVLSHLEELLGESIRDAIVVQRIYAHRDFAHDYHAYKGTALGLSHTLFQSAFWRPKMKHAKVSNLYYVGQYTHPGIGVPMCLIGAENLVKTYFP